MFAIRGRLSVSIRPDRPSGLSRQLVDLQQTDEEALKADAVAELARIGWPAPGDVAILSARRGSRGGLTGRLRLIFAAAQTGPLAIGSSMHKGGGLFAAPGGANGEREGKAG